MVWKEMVIVGGIGEIHNVPREILWLFSVRNLGHNSLPSTFIPAFLIEHPPTLDTSAYQMLCILPVTQRAKTGSYLRQVDIHITARHPTQPSGISFTFLSIASHSG
jgi:hypothetical protein